MTLAQEKGASNWLTALPIEEHGFTLHKGAFRDALSLRYGWTSTMVPSDYARGQQFSVSHALSCHLGDTPQSGITKLEMLQLILCLWFVTVFPLNHTFNQLMVKI